MPIAVEPPIAASTLVVNTPVTINPPTSTNSREAEAVLVDNDTGYFFVVTFNGQTQWLQAWTSALFSVDRNNPTITLTPIATADPANSGQVTATYFLFGDTLPGLYPQSIGRAVASLASGQVSIIGSVAVVNQSPPNANALLVSPPVAAGSPLDSTASVTNADSVLFSAVGVRRFVITNPDAANPIWLGYGHPAVAGSGIGVLAGKRWVEREYNGGSVHAIAAVAGPVVIGYQTF